MNLITDSERQQLLANGRAQRQAIRYGAGDCLPRVNLDESGATIKMRELSGTWGIRG